MLFNVVLGLPAGQSETETQWESEGGGRRLFRVIRTGLALLKRRYLYSSSVMSDSMRGSPAASFAARLAARSAGVKERIPVP